MGDNGLIKTVQNTFSMYGFVITRDVSTFVVRQLKNVNADEREMWLIKITDQLTSLNLQDPHVSLELIKKVIQECLRPNDALQDTETIFNVIHMFDIPKISHDMEKNKLVIDKFSPDLYAEAIYKHKVLRDRLDLVKRITLRQEAFTSRKFGNEDTEKYELTSIESLLSNNSKFNQVYVMGILTQLTEGQYYLEDTDGAIKVHLNKSNFGAGIITEGTIVIVNGILDDGALKVTNIGLPPAEPSKKSRLLFGTENTFGGPSKVSLKQSEKLKHHERAHSMDMIIFLSDVWLDNVDVLDKLRIIIEGYSDDPPIAFIFTGHFLSFPPNVSSGQKLKEGFDNLSKIIQQHPDIRKYSKFVFIPGPHDLGAPKILPRGPLPKTLLKDFIQTVPGAIFASNPCRIQYCTKEIVVMREDVISKLCRNTLKYPDKGHIWDHYAKSIICQSHLAPMCLPVVPIYWRHDHALQIFPTPDLIVAADRFQAYTTNYNNCHVINPGAFFENHFSFKVYKPSTDEVEECQVPADIDM